MKGRGDYLVNQASISPHVRATPFQENALASDPKITNFILPSDEIDFLFFFPDPRSCFPLFPPRTTAPFSLLRGRPCLTFPHAERCPFFSLSCGRPRSSLSRVVTRLSSSELECRLTGESGISRNWSGVRGK